MKLRAWIATLLLIGTLLAACGGSDEGTSIADATDADDGTAVELSGYVVRVGGETRLCEVLAESFPPQCAGESIEVVGLDESTLDMQTQGDVAWTNDRVTLNGTIQDGALDVNG